MLPTASKVIAPGLQWYPVPTEPSDTPWTLNFSTVLPVVQSGSAHQRVTYRLPAASNLMPSVLPGTVPASSALRVPSGPRHCTIPFSNERNRSPAAKVAGGGGDVLETVIVTGSDKQVAGGISRDRRQGM